MPVSISEIILGAVILLILGLLLFSGKASSGYLKIMKRYLIFYLFGVDTLCN